MTRVRLSGALFSVVVALAAVPMVSVGRAVTRAPLPAVTVGQTCDRESTDAGPTSAPRQEAPGTGSLLDARELTSLAWGTRAQGGAAVATSADGSVVAVGIPATAAGGEVDLYYGPHWRLRARLRAPNEQPGDGFGTAVAVSSNGADVFVGAPGAREPAPLATTGNVYAFSGPRWHSATALPVPGAATAGGFGAALALSANDGALVVGSGEDRSFVYIGGGVAPKMATILDIDGTAAVSGNGGVIVGDNEGPYPDSGVEVAYSGPDWAALALLDLDDTEEPLPSATAAVSSNGSIIAFPQFGIGGGVQICSGPSWHQSVFLADSVSLDERRTGWPTSLAMSADGSELLVGTDDWHPSGSASTVPGAAYVLTGPGWSTKRSLTRLDVGPEDSYAWAVALSADGSTAIVGSPGTRGTGAAFVYRLTGHG